MTTVTRTSTVARLLCLVLGGGGLLSVAQAGSIDAIYAFGDSLTDVGNIYAATGGAAPGAPYANGQFTNGNVWVQDLAGLLGLPPLLPSLRGGTDYAYGSAESGVTSFNTAAANTDLVGATGQLAQYQATHPAADPNALYTIWIGSNDLDDMLTGQLPSQYAADIGAVVGNIYGAVGTLAGMGARNFLIVTVPDLGKTPEVEAFGPAESAGASFLTSSFDNALTGGLPGLAAGDSVNISVLDTYTLLDSIVADPTTYGFSNVTQPCLTGGVNYAGGTPCANPNQYLFWDQLHPTAAGHEILAGDALALVTPEPDSFVLMGAGLLGLTVFHLRPKRRRRGLRARFLIALLMAQGIGLAETKPLEARWTELAPMVNGHSVTLTLRDGMQVKGEVIAVREDELQLNVSRAVKGYDKGSRGIPRSDVGSLDVKRKQGIGGRALGTAVGTLGGMGPGAWVDARNNVLKTSLGRDAGAFIGIAAGGAVAGYLAGMAIDTRVTHIRIVP